MDRSRVAEANGGAEVEVGPVSNEPSGETSYSLPEVPAGTVLLGRLVDGDGEPVSRALLTLEGKETSASESLKADAQGRFALAADLHGDVLLHASADGVGRSVDRPLFLPLDQATDVGDIRLIGSGTVRGHVRFPNGDPFPGLSVIGHAVNAEATPGLRRGAAETGPDGSFEIQALAPGHFEFTVAKDENLPVVGNTVYSSGADDALLVVHATLLQVSCMSDAGERVPMKSLELADVVIDESPAEDGYGSTSRGFSDAVERFELVVDPTKHYRIQATGADTRFYLAYLQGDLAPGIEPLVLRSNPDNLGALRLRLAPHAISEEGALRIGQLTCNGHARAGGTVFADGSPQEGWTLEAPGLLPGTYSFTVRVKGDDWAVLEQPFREVEVRAGAPTEIALNAARGGRIELTVTVDEAQSEGAQKIRGKVQIRRAGDPEWSWAELVSKRGNGTSRGSKVWLDGTLARSIALLPGSYQIRLEAEGYLPVDTDVIVTEERAANVQISLLGD